MTTLEYQAANIVWEDLGQPIWAGLSASALGSVVLIGVAILACVLGACELWDQRGRQ